MKSWKQRELILEQATRIGGALTEVFKKARKRGFIAMKPSGPDFCCQSCAGSVIAHRMTKKGLDPATSPSVFYTRQDEQNLRERASLYLAHSGSADDLKWLVAELRSSGLSVRFDFDTADWATKRIHITGVASNDSAMDDWRHPWVGIAEQVVDEAFDRELYDEVPGVRFGQRTWQSRQQVLEALHYAFMYYQRVQGYVRKSDYRMLAEAWLGKPVEMPGYDISMRRVEWQVPQSITVLREREDAAAQARQEQDWTFGYTGK